MRTLRRVATLAIGAATVGLAVTSSARAQATRVKPPAPAADTGSRQVASGYAMVNGLRMYFEVHGNGTKGPSLVLLHGGGSTIGTNFARVLPLLAATRQVIAVEFQAHGHTKDIDRPYTFEGSADDVAALLEQLNITKADVFGFSNGGTTALQLAIRHPSVVNRLIIGSANYRRDGMQDGFWEFMQKGTFADMPQPYKEAFRKIDPSPDALMAMWRRDAERMLAFKDIPDSSVQAIRAPTLVVVGDRDVVRPEHALALARLIPNARLAVIPGGHGEYLGEVSFPRAPAPRVFAAMVEEFLKPPDR
jgi:pimeloyl-ACP methyl ester carboxylesterase